MRVYITRAKKIILKRVSNTRMKTISIVMPCLNAVSYIEDALRSIDNQNDNDIELIVIDGGSTDGTLELLEKKKWPISVLISEPDKGAPDALNKGFSLAKGDVLGWLNADDTYISENAFSIVKKNVFRPICGFCLWSFCWY